MPIIYNCTKFKIKWTCNTSKLIAVYNRFDIKYC